MFHEFQNDSFYFLLFCVNIIHFFLLLQTVYFKGRVIVIRCTVYIQSIGFDLWTLSRGSFIIVYEIGTTRPFDYRLSLKDVHITAIWQDKWVRKKNNPRFDANSCFYSIWAENIPEIWSVSAEVFFCSINLRMSAVFLEGFVVVIPSYLLLLW